MFTTLGVNLDPLVVCGVNLRLTCTTRSLFLIVISHGLLSDSTRNTVKCLVTFCQVSSHVSRLLIANKVVAINKRDNADKEVMVTH